MNIFTRNDSLHTFEHANMCANSEGPDQTAGPLSDLGFCSFLEEVA